MRIFLFLLLFVTSAMAQQTIKDLTVQDLKVVSTTKGSKPCPLMTQTQRDAIASPLNGQCVYNTTTSKLNVYNGSVWKAAGGGVDAWATATVYAVGDLVIESDKIYQCEIAHTSSTFGSDLAAGYWTELSASSTSGVLTFIFSGTNSDISGYESAPSLSSYVVAAEATTSVTATTSPTLIEEFDQTITRHSLKYIKDRRGELKHYWQHLTTQRLLL